MKIIYLLILVSIASINPLFSQKHPSKFANDYTENLPCDCDGYTKGGRRYIPDAKTAQNLINGYLQAIAKHSKIRTSSDPIYVLEANCDSPMAALCPGDIRLILFNKYFFELINAKDEHTVTLVDKHVMAHELGHHVLGHFKKIGSLNEVEKIYEKDKGYLKKKFITNNNPMAQEIEADLFALWLLYKLEKGFQADMLINQIDTMRMETFDKRFMKQRTVTTTAKNAKEEEKSYSTHPFFSDRIKIMRQYQNTVKKLQTTTKTRSFADLGNSAFMDLWPSRAYWDLSLSGGVVLGGIPDFSADGQKVDAFMYAFNKKTSFFTGLSLTHFRWDKPWQTTLDIHWSRQHYGTAFLINDGRKLAEELHLDYLTFSPQIGWNSDGASRRGSLSVSKRGFLVNVGANFFFPTGLSYTNYIVASAPTPKLRFSAMPKVSIGLAFTKKTFMPRNLKWLISYEPQRLRLDVTPKPTAISHNFTTTLQYAIVRR
jgi:hypothetical protein